MSLSADIDRLQAHLAAKPGAAGEALASAKGVALYKVMGKMFAILNVGKFNGVIVKCDPHLVDILKQQYAGVGHRGHLDRRFWISLNLDSDVPLDEIKRLVDGSYDLICAGLTKKQRAEVAALAG